MWAQDSVRVLPLSAGTVPWHCPGVRGQWPLCPHSLCSVQCVNIFTTWSSECSLHMLVPWCHRPSLAALWEGSPSRHPCSLAECCPLTPAACSNCLFHRADHAIVTNFIFIAPKRMPGPQGQVNRALATPAPAPSTQEWNSVGLLSTPCGNQCQVPAQQPGSTLSDIYATVGTGVLSL